RRRGDRLRGGRRGEARDVRSAARPLPREARHGRHAPRACLPAVPRVARRGVAAPCAARGAARDTRHAVAEVAAGIPRSLVPGRQNWGLPPLSPRGLVESAYAPFIATLRANMARAGALRIDHVMGLERLFWVPEGAEPSAGAYVRYPLEDLLAILALESQRHRCLVIGEDLGTVSDDLCRRLQAADVLSYRLLLFERDGDAFRPPSAYPRRALVAWSTHDLPTLAGWL